MLAWKWLLVLTLGSVVPARADFQLADANRASVNLALESGVPRSSGDNVDVGDLPEEQYSLLAFVHLPNVLGIGEPILMRVGGRDWKGELSTWHEHRSRAAWVIRDRGPVRLSPLVPTNCATNTNRYFQGWCLTDVLDLECRDDGFVCFDVNPLALAATNRKVGTQLALGGNTGNLVCVASRFDSFSGLVEGPFDQPNAEPAYKQTAGTEYSNERGPVRHPVLRGQIMFGCFAIVCGILVGWRATVKEERYRAAFTGLSAGLISFGAVLACGYAIGVLG